MDSDLMVAILGFHTITTIFNSHTNGTNLTKDVMKQIENALLLIVGKTEECIVVSF